MFFRAAVVSAIALFAANGALGSALPVDGVSGTSDILIAIDAYYACNCPLNCDHSRGDSCKYRDGPSDTSSIVTGTCEYPNGGSGTGITCIRH